MRAEGDAGFARRFLATTARILESLDAKQIELLVDLVDELRRSGGRLFVVGSGGGAAHASHAAADFRTIAGIDAYAPTDNVAELTARINDDGWESSYADCLRASRLSGADAILVLSVGGGDVERGVSTNLVACLELASSVGARICGIVGRDGGRTAAVADACVVIPTVDPSNVTAQVEGIQAVVWHLLVAHPRLRTREMRWETIE